MRRERLAGCSTGFSELLSGGRQGSRSRSRITTYMFLSRPRKVIRLELILTQVPRATNPCGSLKSVDIRIKQVGIRGNTSLQPVGSQTPSLPCSCHIPAAFHLGLDSLTAQSAHLRSTLPALWGFQVSMSLLKLLPRPTGDQPPEPEPEPPNKRKRGPNHTACNRTSGPKVLVSR